MKTNLVIDTDIGTDPDDAFALAYAIKNNADIKAVTTSVGNPEIRGKIARKLERILGVDIPVIIGQSSSKEIVKKYWCGFEEDALTEQEIDESLKEYPLPKYNQDDTLVCIAPLLNIAYQLEKNPSIRNIKTIYLMGSDYDCHNLKVAPKEAKKVLAQSWNIYMIRKEDSKKIYFTRNDLEQFRGSELGNFLYNSAIRWQDYTLKEKLPMYDVLTVSAALGENFVKFKQLSKNRFVSCDVDLKLKDRIVEVIKE